MGRSLTKGLVLASLLAASLQPALAQSAPSYLSSPPVAPAWGAITGTLANQTDLNASLKALPSIVCQSGVAVSHTGDTTETTLATCTIPAASMGANGEVHILGDFSGVSGTSTKTVRIKFGGTTLWSRVMVSTETATRVDVSIFNRNGTGTQRYSSTQVNSSNLSVIGGGTTAVDTTAAVTLLITEQNANAADTASVEAYQVLLRPHS